MTRNVNLTFHHCKIMKIVTNSNLLYFKNAHFVFSLSNIPQIEFTLFTLQRNIRILCHNFIEKYELKYIVYQNIHCNTRSYNVIR